MNSNLSKYFIIIYLLLLFNVSCNNSYEPSVSLSAPASGDYSRMDDCSAVLENDTLILENSLIRRKFLWNEGNLISSSLTDKTTGKTWYLTAGTPDCWFLDTSTTSSPRLTIKEIEGTSNSYPYLQAEVSAVQGDLAMKRVFRIYPFCPAIACTFYLKGEPSENWSDRAVHFKESRGSRTEEDPVMIISNRVPVLERLAFREPHWEITTVSFSENTDYYNTLVHECSSVSFVNARNKESRYRGTLLLAAEPVSGDGLFILKEAPPVQSQLAYPGWDFVCRGGEFQGIGAGILPSEIMEDKWRACYGFATGVTGRDELSARMAVRNYLMRQRLRKPGRDDMILMNTWGDRSRGAKLSEEFCLAELEAGNRLGITHFQLDAGWQESMQPGEEEFFGIVDEKFPNGFAPLIEKGDELGIEVCLWTDPGREYTYAAWETFADSVISMYNRYGIRTYKFDGVEITDKTSEERIRGMLDKIMEATGNDAVINFDITMAKRVGYHYFNEYGNYFVENRYTDWKNYYPHWTLRNLWMLSEYIPPRQLQVEFLNKWRNQENYSADDPLAPFNVPFDYIFATTIMGQPLAWFEATGLPEEAFEIAPMVKKYREIMSDIHSGYVFPAGDEPSGTSWTGFQSMIGNRGYFLVLREYNDEADHLFSTWLNPGSAIKCSHIFGHGRDFSAKADEEGRVKFSLPGPFTFALYAYETF